MGKLSQFSIQASKIHPFPTTPTVLLAEGEGSSESISIESSSKLVSADI